MISLVSLQRAKTHLRIVVDDHDSDISMKVQQASEIIMDYLKLAALPAAWGDAQSPIVYTVPALHQAACLLVLSELYENRESSTSDPLTPAVKSLLMRNRDPALA